MAGTVARGPASSAVRARRGSRRRGWPLAQTAGVADPEVGAGERAEAVEVVVVPAGIRRAGDVPVGAVVGEEHPVALQRGEDDPGLRAVAADVDARLEPDAEAHRWVARA